MNPFLVLIQAILLLGGIFLVCNTVLFTGALPVGIAALALFVLILVQE